MIPGDEPRLVRPGVIHDARKSVRQHTRHQNLHAATGDYEPGFLKPASYAATPAQIPRGAGAKRPNRRKKTGPMRQRKLRSDRPPDGRRRRPR